MKRLIVGALGILVVPFLLFAGVTSAQSFRSGDNSSLPSGETVDGSLWISGNTVEVAGTVNGDVYCAGMNVNVTGTVRGDVLCAGQSVRIAGVVEGDIRAAGQTVTVGREVQGSVTVAAQNFNIEGSASVAGDVSAAATSIALNGTVGRDAVLAASTATITSIIGRNVEVTVDTLMLSGGARVQGNLAYANGTEAQIANGAQVNGETIRRDRTEQKDVRNNWGFGILAALYFALSLLAFSILLALLVPRFFWKVTDTGVQSPLLAFLVGLAAAIILPAVLFTLAITLIGLPIALFVSLLWIVALLLSGPLVAFYIGRLLIENRGTIMIMLVGSIILLLLYFVPILGFIVMLLVSWMSLGMLLISIWQRRGMVRNAEASVRTSKS